MHIVRIEPKDARAVGQGHPWVYREAVRERPRSLKPGDIVDVATMDNDFIARGLYDPGASIAVRVWTRERGEFPDTALVARRVREAVAVRERAGVPAQTDAYRLVNAESDFLPGVIVDRWGDHLTLTLQGDALRRWEPTILAGLEAVETHVGVYVRDEDGSASRHVAGDPCPGEMTLREPTGRYLARIDTAGKPGLFTDMRDVRRALAPHLRGRSFLNLFAHTGAFSGCAAGAGATQIVSVDLSKPALDVARRNVEANKDLNGPGTSHEAVAADVFDALKGFAAAARRFDVILADPPTFSSSKASGAFNVKDHYRSLVRASLRVLEPGGLFVAATNFRGTDTDTFLRTLHDAAESERARLRVLEIHGQPADYPSMPMVPETRHLRVVFCAVTPAAPDA